MLMIQPNKKTIVLYSVGCPALVKSIEYSTCKHYLGSIRIHLLEVWINLKTGMNCKMSSSAT